MRRSGRSVESAGGRFPVRIMAPLLPSRTGLHPAGRTPYYHTASHPTTPDPPPEAHGARYPPTTAGLPHWGRSVLAPEYGLGPQLCWR